MQGAGNGHGVPDDDDHHHRTTADHDQRTTADHDNVGVIAGPHSSSSSG